MHSCRAATDATCRHHLALEWAAVDVLLVEGDVDEVRQALLGDESDVVEASGVVLPDGSAA